MALLMTNFASAKDVGPKLELLYNTEFAKAISQFKNCHRSSLLLHLINPFEIRCIFCISLTTILVNKPAR